MPFTNDVRSGIGQGEVMDATDTTAEVMTEAFETRGLRTLSVMLDLYERSTVTQIEMVVDHSIDGGATWYEEQALDDTNKPDHDLQQATWTKKTISAPGKWIIHSGHGNALQRMRFTCSGGSAGDKLRVYVYGERMDVG